MSEQDDYVGSPALHEAAVIMGQQQERLDALKRELERYKPNFPRITKKLERLTAQNIALRKELGLARRKITHLQKKVSNS